MSSKRRAAKRVDNVVEIHRQTDRNLQLGSIKPKTLNQEKAWKAFADGKHLMLAGSAGVGKTFLSMYLSLREVEKGLYHKVVVVRSAVPTRSQGFLPGSLKEKAKVFEAPFMGVCNDLYHRGDAYDILKMKNKVEFITTSYLRGITLSDCIIVVDEAASMTFHELDSIITRVGQNCRIIVMGDCRQSDLQKGFEKQGFRDFIKVAKSMGSFELIEFTHADILRSDVVKEFIIARDKLGIE